MEPTITKYLENLVVSGPATGNLPQEEIDNITYAIMETYGVTSDKVQTTVEYIASGSLDVQLPQNISQNVTIIIIQNGIMLYKYY